jgi:hypothetical protein
MFPGRSTTFVFSFPSRARPLFLAVAMLALAGCGADAGRAAVQGTVSYGGEPVDSGGIAFLPDGGGDAQVQATGDILDGHYNLEGGHGPSPGKYRVQIYWQKKTGRKITSRSGTASREVTEQVIPANYNENSELTVDVQPGRNTFDFDLKK